MARETVPKLEILKASVRPNLGKTLIFLMLTFIIIMLPLYPAHSKITRTMIVENGDEISPQFINSSTATTYQSFLLVLAYDFEWVEEDIEYIQDDVFILRYDSVADPVYSWALFIPLLAGLYVASGLAFEYYTWGDSLGRKKEPDVHLWKPPKES